jgi:hypothetical protein
LVEYQADTSPGALPLASLKEGIPNPDEKADPHQTEPASGSKPANVRKALIASMANEQHDEECSLAHWMRSWNQAVATGNT